MKLNWNFQRGGGSYAKSLPWRGGGGGYGYFLEPHIIVRRLNAQFRPDRDKSDKSTKFGTQFAYTLPNDIRRGAHVNLVMLPF